MAIKEAGRIQTNIDRHVTLASDTGTVKLNINQIRTDGGTQPRAGLNVEIVKEYKHDMENGDRFPPLQVMYDGEHYWLYDGFHRLAAMQEMHHAYYAGPVEVTVHQGTLADAQWQSFAVNKGHGLRRTNADKERAVKAALRHPNGAQMSNSAIARHVGVDDKTVAVYRHQLEVTSEIPKSDKRTYTTKHGTVAVMDTAKIGQGPPKRTPVWELEMGVRNCVTAEGDQERLAILDNLSSLKTESPHWPRLMDALHNTAIPDGSWRKGDLLSAVRNVREQMLQDLRRRTDEAMAAKPQSSMDAALAIPDEPAWEEEHRQAAQEPMFAHEVGAQHPEAALPLDLREAGYTIEPWHGQWRWKRLLWGGPSFEYSAPYKSIIDVIEDARKRIAARAAKQAAQEPPKPDLDSILRKIAKDQTDWETLLNDLAEGKQGWYDDLVLCYVPADVDRDLLAAAAKRVLAEMRGSRPASLDSLPVVDSTDPAKPTTKAQERAAAKERSARIEMLEHLQSLYRAVLDTLGSYEQVTGLYTHTPAARRAILPMLEMVERNLAALCGEGDKDA